MLLKKTFDSLPLFYHTGDKVCRRTNRISGNADLISRLQVIDIYVRVQGQQHSHSGVVLLGYAVQGISGLNHMDRAGTSLFFAGSKINLFIHKDTSTNDVYLMICI